jgi:uncharacterized protein (TIGR02597 family)
MSPSKRLHLTAAALCALAIAPAFAQTTATSTPAGFVTLNCPANSDTRISTPLTRPPVFTGAVTTPLPGAGSTVTVAGTPGWTNNQFGPLATVPPTPTHYAAFGPAASSYAAEGKFFPISGNNANSLTLDLAGDDISSVPANAQVQVIPYWTLGTLFPAADANVSFQPTTIVAQRKTEILIPNHAAAGTNNPPAVTYFFFNGAWRKSGQALTTSFDTDILPPTDNFIVRNKETATSLVNLGGVEIKKVTTPLVSLAGAASVRQDNFVAIVRPVDVKIRDLGLTPPAFVTTTVPATLQDQILVFDNTAAATNKPPTATYFFFDGAFRKVGQPLTTDFGDDVIPAGAGFVIRKAGTAGGTTAFWTNDRTYNP